MSHDENKDKEPSPEHRDESQLEFDQNSFSDNPRRLEPIFENFDTEDSLEDTYEDPDESTFTDSRYSSEYEEDTIDYEVDAESLMADEDEFDPGPEPVAPWQAEELKPELIREVEPTMDSVPNVEQEDAEAWLDDTGYSERVEDDETGGAWPLGMIVIAVIALLLLGAGGYGVMQQRTAMQEEIRVLQAAVATSASPDEVIASRESQRILDERNTELQTTVDALQMEIRSLQDTARGLEAQLTEARSVAAARASQPPPAPIPVAPKPAPVKDPSVTVSDDNWFVNFSSYESKDTANSWAARLQPAAGKVVVVSGTRNGDTFYRVRVVELANKKQAQGIARTLEQEYDLSKLWIGEQ